MFLSRFFPPRTITEEQFGPLMGERNLGQRATRGGSLVPRQPDNRAKLDLLFA